MMKKIFLTIIAMALMAISANAQEVCSFNPDNVLGLDMDKETVLAAGTVIGETANIVATIGADNIYSPQSVKATVTGGEINGGLQGSSNPYDADGGLPAITLNAPVSGAYLEFKAKADGFLYVIINTFSNKTYTVFEEGTAIGYTFAAIGDASTDLGAVYQFTLVGEGELNEIKYPIERAEQEFLKATDPEKYAAHLTTNKDGTVSWTAIKVNGLGVIKFPVYKDCKYIVNGSGTKILASGYVFSTKENVTISSDGMTIIDEGDTEKTVELYFNFIENGNVAELIQSPDKYRGTVIIPSTVTHEGIEYSVKIIGEKAFYYCQELTSVTIPNSVTSIGNEAFYKCSGLTSITIPNSVISIGGGAFGDCSGLTSVYIPNSVTSINGAFYGCSSLTSVTIPNSVTSIGDGTFDSCYSLTSITIPSSVKSIGWGAFTFCTKLKSVTIPNSVTFIGNEAFRDCYSLKSITIPSSVKTIGENAFWKCNHMNSITIESGVTLIKDQAFSNCYDLTDVYCLSEKVSKNRTSGALYAYPSAFADSDPEEVTLHVPVASIETYRSTEPWSQFKAIVAIEDGDNPEIKKCATPEISYANGKVSLSCETEGVDFISEVTVADAKKYYDSEFNLFQTYKITVYATKAGYENSDVATREIVIENGQTTLFGDLDKDGKVNVADHVKLSDIIMNK